ncbi:hypothetical protein BH09BAC5_BH09BAC5_12900 [soil metagenome]
MKNFQIKTNFVFTIISVILLNSANAQSPILTAANSNPILGDNYIGNGIPYTSPGNAGANQTWDFSTLVSGGTQNISFVDPLTTTNASTFPNSTIALFNSTNSYYEYFSASASEIANEGYVYGPPLNLIEPYSNPQVVLNYPFTMGSNFVDSYYGTYTSGANTINRTGTSTVTADGYGTLILPYGTFTNALRVLLIDDYADTTTLGVPYSQITFTTYNWYIPGTHYQILSLTTITSNGGPPLSQFGNYLSANPLSIASNENQNFNFNIFPNPSNGNFSIESTTKYSTIEIANTLGEIIYSSKINSDKAEIDLSNQPTGIYFATIQNGEEIIYKKIIIAK